jgi:hypothetical protein
MTGAHRATFHMAGQQDQEALVVLDRAAEVVGQLDEHGEQ